MPDASLFHEHRVVVDHDGMAEFLPGFLAHGTAERFFAGMRDGLPWEQAELVVFGRPVTEPRLSVWFAPEGMDYAYSGARRTAHRMPPLLEELRLLVADVVGTPFNSALANLYRTGGDSLGWHADDEECNGPEPVIASVSLGAERRFDLRHNATGETRSVLLPHGSLLVMSGPLQRHWKHRVPATRRVGSARINVTFRLVS